MANPLFFLCLCLVVTFSKRLTLFILKFHSTPSTDILYFLYMYLLNKYFLNECQIPIHFNILLYYLMKKRSLFLLWIVRLTSVWLHSSSRSLVEKAMAPHSSPLAWRIPWVEEPGRLQSMGSLRVRYDEVTSLSLFTFMHWRRKWQPTPVCLPEESQGRGSLVGCRLWGRTQSDTTEVT